MHIHRFVCYLALTAYMFLCFSMHFHLLYILRCNPRRLHCRSLTIDQASGNRHPFNGIGKNVFDVDAVFAAVFLFFFLSHCFCFSDLFFRHRDKFLASRERENESERERLILFSPSIVTITSRLSMPGERNILITPTRIKSI